MASTASSALTAKLLYHYRPRYLFMTGIAAAVDPKECSLGDIMVAEECWDGASGKYKDGKFYLNEFEVEEEWSAFEYIEVTYDDDEENDYED